MSLPCLINAEFLQVQDSFGQGAEAGFVVYFKKTKKKGETPERRRELTLWSSGGTQQSLAMP